MGVDMQGDLYSNRINVAYWEYDGNKNIYAGLLGCLRIRTEVDIQYNVDGGSRDTGVQDQA